MDFFRLFETLDPIYPVNPRIAEHPMYKKLVAQGMTPTVAAWHVMQTAGLSAKPEDPPVRQIVYHK